MVEHAGAEELKNAQRELFCHEYLKDLNVAQAGSRAGYASRQSAHDAFKSDEVQERISFLKKERMEQLGIDAYYVLSNLKTVVERCLQAEEVLDREGAGTGEYKFEHTGANKALELLGKHIGMFKDKVEVTGKDGGPIQQEVKTQPKYTPEELAELTAQELSRLCIHGKL